MLHINTLHIYIYIGRYVHKMRPMNLKTEDCSGIDKTSFTNLPTTIAFSYAYDDTILNTTYVPFRL